MRKRSSNRPNAAQQIINSLRTGAKFGWEIQVDWKKKDLNTLYRRRYICRSSNRYTINGSPSYAYALPQADGQTLKWSYSNQPFSDSFHVCPLEDARVRNRGLRGTFQSKVADALEQNGAMFAPEIHQFLVKNGTACNLRNVWKALVRLKRAGSVTVFDEAHGGWKFVQGHLVALAGEEAAFSRRLDMVDDEVVTPAERRLLMKVRGAIYTAKELKEEIGIDDSR